MKKITVFILASLFCFSLFAAPKIPKITLDSDEDEPDELIYVSNDLQNYYILKAWCSDISSNYHFTFIKDSISNDILIAINIYCNSEQEIDYIISKIDTTDIDNEFTKLRKNLILLDLTPDIFSNINHKPTKVIYNIKFLELLF